MAGSIASVGAVFVSGKAIRADHGPHGVVWFRQVAIGEYQHFKNGSVGSIDRDTIERAVEKAEEVETVWVEDSPFEEGA